MSLNIKDPEAYRLAKYIAEATGDSMTHVVVEALRERYEQLKKRSSEAIAADMRAIAKRVSSSIKSPYVDHAELLYDENGLPK